MQVDILQGRPVGGLGIAEGHIFKVHGAILHGFHGVFVITKLRLFHQNLGGSTHRRPGHGDHDEHHGQHHKRAEYLNGEGEHGGQLAGGQAHGSVVARGHNHSSAQIGDHQNAGVHRELHQRIVEGQGLLRLAEILVDTLGHGGELVSLPALPDEGLHHPDAVDIFLHHVVELIVGLEHPVKDGENNADQDKQSQSHQRQHHTVDDAEPGADGEGVGCCQNQHHGAADGHTDHHLEGHLDICHVRGQTGDDRCRGKFVDVGKVKILHLVIHIVPQVPGKAGGGVGCQHRRGNAENQGNQGVEHQQAAVTHHRAHIAYTDTFVHNLGKYQWNLGFHVNLADHANRGQNRRPFVFPDTPGKGFYHAFGSSFFDCPFSGQTLSMARCKRHANCAFSSSEKP